MFPDFSTSHQLPAHLKREKVVKEDSYFPFLVGLEVNWAYIISISCTSRGGECKKSVTDVEPSSLSFLHLKQKKLLKEFPFLVSWLAGKQVPWILNTAVTPREVHMREHNWGKNCKKVKNYVTQFLKVPKTSKTNSKPKKS